MKKLVGLGFGIIWGDMFLYIRNYNSKLVFLEFLE
jgi:hypothetical protein